MEKQSDWENLLDERCPLCGHNLMEMDGWWQCSQRAEFFQKCKFTISDEKFQNLCYKLQDDTEYDAQFDQDEEMEPF